jgi:general stress protein 26
MAELKEKIFEAVQNPQLASLATITEEGKPWVRYVMVTGNRDMTLRCATFVTSRKVAQIRKNPEVHITCGVTDLQSMQPYLQIQGRAEILTDETERHGYWKEELTRYFSGKDDPNYCVVRVTPSRIEYMSPGSYEPEVWDGGA